MDGLKYRQPQKLGNLLMNEKSSHLMEKVFSERVKSLIEDRYMVRVRHTSPTLWFVRLHHMCNGNDIILKCYPLEKRVMQLTNHVKVYEEVF